jgi:hypothetical protein
LYLRPQVKPTQLRPIQSPKRCVLKKKQDGVLGKDKTMGNVQKHNICRIVFLARPGARLKMA